MIIYAGDYIREEIPVESAGITVNFYYSRKHQPVMEAMNAAESIRQTIEYCTEHIGPLSFYGDGTFNLIDDHALCSACLSGLRRRERRSLSSKNAFAM